MIVNSEQTLAPLMLHAVPDFTGKGGIPDYAKVPGVFDLNNYVARYDGEVSFSR